MSEIFKTIQGYFDKGDYAAMNDKSVIEQTSRIYLDDRPAFNLCLSALKQKAHKDSKISKQDLADWKVVVSQKATAIKSKIDLKDKEEKQANTLAEIEALKQSGESIMYRGDHVELAEMVCEKLELHGELTYDGSRFWRCDNQTRVWYPVSDAMINVEITKLAGTSIIVQDKIRSLNVTAGAINGAYEILANLKNWSELHEGGKGFFNQAWPGVMFRNGFLSCDVGKNEVDLLPVTKDARAMVGFDFDYFDNEPDTPLFDRYLDSLFSGDADQSDKQEMFMQVLGGAILGVGASFQKATVLYDNTERSQGANGKSVALKILQAILPSHTVSSISPVQFEERFSRVGLFGVRANLIAEMPEDGDFISGETTKAIISGDSIQAEYKGRDVFSFRPTATHIVACNRMPRIRDTSDAFWRRWQALAFNNSFEGNNAIRDIDKKIIAKELPGVTLKLVQAGVRLINDGEYTIPASSLDIFRTWKTECNPVAMFIEECCEYHQEGQLSAREFYNAYVEYCKDNGFKAVSTTRFGRDAGAIVRKIKKSGSNYYQVSLKQNAFFDKPSCFSLIKND